MDQHFNKITRARGDQNEQTVAIQFRWRMEGGRMETEEIEKIHNQDARRYA